MPIERLSKGFKSVPSRRRAGSRLRAIAVAAGLVGALMAGGAPVAAADPAVAVTVEPATASVQSGGQLSYLVAYSCSTLVAECTDPVVVVPPPVGVAPDASAAPAATFASVAPNADVTASTAEGAGVRVALRSLAGGSVGQISVNWQVPNLTVLPGTTYAQSVTFSASGATSSASSDPISVSSAASLSGGLIMVSPGKADQVQADTDVVYRLFDCNPALPALGALDYRDASVSLVLPEGTLVVDAEGGAVSGSTVTWTDAAPTANDCGAPARAHEITVRYPSTSFQPPPAATPQSNTVSVTASVSATALDGTVLASEPTPLEHVFKGLPINPPNGEYFLYWHKYDYDKKASDLALTNVDTTTEYDVGLTQYWYLQSGGQKLPTGPGGYQTQAVQDRVPCVVNGAVTSPQPSDSDPIYTQSPTTWNPPSDQCITPAFRATTLEFPNIAARTVESVEFYTTDGAGGRQHYRWTRTTPPDGSFGAYVFDIYGTSATAAAPEPPTLPGGVMSETGSEVHAPEAPSPLWDPTFTNPERIPFGVPVGETLTDLRVVYTYVPYFTYVTLGLTGTSTPAFAATGALQMTNTMRAFDLCNAEYEYSQAPIYGAACRLTGRPWPFTQTFRPAQPDPQVTMSATSDATLLAPGATTSWSVSIANGANGSPLAPRLVVVLPPGLEMIDGSEEWAHLDAVDGVEPARTVVQQDGYADGISRTSIVYSWPPGTVLDNPSDEMSPDHASYSAGTLPTLTFSTRVQLQATEGSHTVDTAMSATLFDATTDLTPAGATVPQDTHDLDADGVTAEAVGFSSVGWTTVATSGARIEQAVRGDLDADWTTTGNATGSWPVGGTAEYRIRVFNDNVVPIGDLVIYDVLPHLGDTAIGEALAGEPRGSAWPVEFSAVTEVGGAEIAYSTSADPCRPELFPAGQSTCASWSTTAGDPAQVRALRFTIPGPLSPGDGSTPVAELRFSVTVPGTEPVAWATTPVTVAAPSALTAAALAVPPSTATGTANNNVAWRATRLDPIAPPLVLPPAEAPITTLAAASASISGRAWCDVDDDAIRDAGEAPAPGVDVALVDAAGSPITNASGTPVAMRSESDGTHGFTAPFGDYRLRFSGWTDDVGIATAHIGGDPTADSDADPVTGLSDLLALDPAQPAASAVDVGLRTAQVELSGAASDVSLVTGATVVHTLTVTNPSPDLRATGVRLVDTLGVGLSFVSSSAPASAVDDQVIIELGDLDPGASETVAVTARYDGSVPASQTSMTARLDVASPCPGTDTVVTSLAVSSSGMAQTGVSPAAAMLVALAALTCGWILIRRRRAVLPTRQKP